MSQSNDSIKSNLRSWIREVGESLNDTALDLMVGCIKEMRLVGEDDLLVPRYEDMLETDDPHYTTEEDQEFYEDMYDHMYYAVRALKGVSE